jgi:hypothetical protein
MALEQGTVTPNYTFAFDFLATWVPLLNDSFEREETQSKQGVVSPLQPQNETLLSGLYDVRTYIKNTYADHFSLVRQWTV